MTTMESTQDHSHNIYNLIWLLKTSRNLIILAVALILVVVAILIAIKHWL
uniref:Uncharacterized protein n=1 Tax=Octopus bimaculoides TaxID=37653 RepID=A0A0L8I8L2_OCTBM